MCTTKMNDSTPLKKLGQSDAAFINLTKRVLDQSHIHRHFQLVEEDGTPCTMPATVEARLRAIAKQGNKTIQNCHVTVISTLCIENKCPNAFQVQRKTLSSIIAFRKDGVVDTRVWCLFCRQTEAFHNIIPKLLEKHPKKHFVLLHPETKAKCTTYAKIMTALHAYRALQPEITPANLKVVVRSTHVAAGGCRCATDFVNEHSLFNIAFNLEDGPNSRVWSKECARKTISEDRKALYPKGVDTTGTIESIRQNMLAQLLVELSDLTISRIQQGRIYDALISNKASPDTLGAVVQFATGCRQKNGSSAAFNKEITRIIDILESGALFIGQEMSKDGQTMNRILVLSPCALDRVMDLKVKSLRLTNPVTKILNEFVFKCDQPEQMQKMVRLLEAHIDDPTSLRMDSRTANAHMDSKILCCSHRKTSQSCWNGCGNNSVRMNDQRV